MRDTHHSVAVIGAGQAGLSVSYHLLRRGIDHVILEANRAGWDWRERRWDSFCLVTPNWQCRLPGFPYPGTDPDGFMVRDEIVAYLDEYVKSYPFPLVEHTPVTRLRRDADGTFRLTTRATESTTRETQEVTADQVVVATGPYQVPRTPRLAERIGEGIVQVHSCDYRSPGQLPPGAVLVVGTGQSGSQIAEDLHLAGREVHLSVGSAPRVARFYRGRDVVAWLDEMGYYRRPVTGFADAEAVRLRANHYVTGRDGGHDIDLRAFARDGMRLYGRLTAATTSGTSGISGASTAGGATTGGTLTFGDDLKRNLDGADAVSESIKDSIDGYIAAHQIIAPVEPRYTPVWEPEDPPRPATLDLGAAGIGAIVWATGFGTDYRWIDIPVFDGRGYPTHHRGETICPGMYFIGLPWQHTWGSGRFAGVADDAEYLARRIAGFSVRDEVTWIAGTPMSTFPSREAGAAGDADDTDWVAPRTVA